MAKIKDKAWKPSKTPCLPGNRTISIQAIIASIVDKQLSNNMPILMQHKESGSVPQGPMKPGYTPGKSKCSSKKRSPLRDQSCLPNRKRFFIFEDELELDSVHSKQVKCEESFYESSEIQTKPEWINEADEVWEECDETTSTSLHNSENSDLNTHLQEEIKCEDTISFPETDSKAMWQNEADEVWEEEDGAVREPFLKSDNKTFKTKQHCTCRSCVKRRKEKANLSTNENYKCTECKEAVRNPSALTQHWLYKHGLIGSYKARIPFGCKICNFTCDYKCDLGKHMRYHSEERPFECSMCDHKTHFLPSLKRHMITHNKPKRNEKFKCEHCN